MDTHGLIVTARASKDLLDSPVFVATVNALSEQLKDGAFDTAINDINKRNDLFLLHRALVTIVNMLKESAKLLDTIQDEDLIPDSVEDYESSDLSKLPEQD